MKQILWLCALVCICSNLNAQSLKRIGDRLKQKIENKTSEKIDKEIDKAVDGDGKTKTKKSAGKKESDEQETSDPDESVASSNSEESNESSDESITPTLSSYSKFDFIPGDKIVAFGNFEKDAVGDFPVNWNTNGTAEVVTLSNKPGKWLKLNKEGTFHPEFINEIPENFTLEFDLGVNNDFSYYSTDIAMAMGFLAPGDDFRNLDYSPHFGEYEGLRFSFHPVNAGLKNARVNYYVSNKGNHRLSGDLESTAWNNKKKNFAHVSIWRQKTRMRVYVNEEKVFDLPRAFDMNSKYNSIVFSIGNMNNDKDFYVINNIRLAVGAPDTRNKLITEGKFVTSGILFDVNSDKIKPESYGVLKDIASVLNDNPSVKINIVGHTDADGDDKSNLELSKRRAESVKKALSSEFKVDASRIQSDGKGESQPVDKNDTESGKANNRRVEFIKVG